MVTSSPESRSDAAWQRPTDERVSVPPIVPRGLVVLLGAAAVVVVAAGARSMAWLLGPAFLALIIVVALAPVQRWLRQRNWPGWAVTGVLVVLVYGVVLVIAASVVFSLARLATAVPQYLGDGQRITRSAMSALARFGIGPEQLRQATQSLDLGKLAGYLSSFLGDIAGLATNFVFILALLLFLSVETSGAGSRFALIGMDRPAVSQAMNTFASGTRRYLLVSSVFGLIVAVLDTAALLLIGVPLAVTWGVLSFVTNYIPNVGFVLGLIPPAVLALLVGGPREMLLVIVVYCVINFVVQSLIQPRFVGDSVGLSVTVTFLSLVFWAWLLGPLGAILAVPLTLLAKVLLVDLDPRAGWADALLRSSPPDLDGQRSEVKKTAKRGKPWWRGLRARP